MAMIYRAPWKPHECPTGELSIPEVLPCLSDENKIVPTQIPSLYAFLTLAPSLDVHSAPYYLNFYAFYETPGCTWRLIHVDKCFECLNQSSVLSLTMTKNLQSGQCNKRMSLCETKQRRSAIFYRILRNQHSPSIYTWWTFWEYIFLSQWCNRKLGYAGDGALKHVRWSMKQRKGTIFYLKISRPSKLSLVATWSNVQIFLSGKISRVDEDIRW